MTPFGNPFAGAGRHLDFLEQRRRHREIANLSHVDAADIAPIPITLDDAERLIAHNPAITMPPASGYYEQKFNQNTGE